ncbi:MAG TPA: universal stress protein [Polyangiaceae bacterium]|nr:universal stress protein [Polyangiaceae bacterium]
MATVPVVIGIDFSPAGDVALKQAFAMVNATPFAEPHVVYVAAAYGAMVRIDTPDEVFTLGIEEAAERLRAHVESVVESFRLEHETFFDRVVTHIRVGSPAREIAQLAADLDADMVIVGTHGHTAVRRLLLGSVTEGIMRLARCPVLVVRPKDHGNGAVGHVPEIEPPCPICIQTRRQSGGAQMWCAQHTGRHGRRHTYHYVSRNVSAQENVPLLRPL